MGSQARRLRQLVRRRAEERHDVFGDVEEPSALGVVLFESDPERGGYIIAEHGGRYWSELWSPRSKTAIDVFCVALDACPVLRFKTVGWSDVAAWAETRVETLLGLSAQKPERRGAIGRAHVIGLAVASDVSPEVFDPGFHTMERDAFRGNRWKRAFGGPSGPPVALLDEIVADLAR